MSKKDASAGSPAKKAADKKNASEKSSHFFSPAFGTVPRSLIIAYSIGMGLLSYFLYDRITAVPDLPKLDMEQWWGPYPLDTKPDTSVRPFEIKFDDVMVNDLRERLLHQRPFTPPLEDSGFTYGFNTIFLTQILDYWKNKYNFQEREDFLNRYNHFKTKIQGLDIHFMRVKPAESSGVEVVPLLMLHGWPGSFREFYEIIPKLTKPREGYKFVFEVIVPSLPGFGYSEGAARSGLGPVQMAVVMHNLMQRLGYNKYFIHGGDVGGAVGSSMATLFPENILGYHTSTPLVIHKFSWCYYLLGSVFPNWVVESPELAPRMFPVTRHLAFLLQESGYFHLQATKPDTIGSVFLTLGVLVSQGQWLVSQGLGVPGSVVGVPGSVVGVPVSVVGVPVSGWCPSVSGWCPSVSGWCPSQWLVSQCQWLVSQGQWLVSQGQWLVSQCQCQWLVSQGQWHLAFLLQESGYFHLQATKPDTIGVALTDSPAGLAAYILEKFSTWTNPDFMQSSDGNLLQKYALNQLLDNVMIYWASNCVTTSARVYKEYVKNLALQMDEIPTPVPTAGIKFKHDLIFTPDVILKLKYTNYLRSTIVEDGGHFAAMELPHILADDVYEAVQEFKHFNGNQSTEAPPLWETAKTIYEFTVTDINGKDVKLDRYKGHVTIIVNVASQCGFTDTNYKQLNELYDKYSATKGLRILAFPCNQFGGQEPGGPEAIFNFAKDRGVKFDLFQKVEVNGDNAHPLWKFLKRSQSGTIGDFIKWNFSKFIIDKNGVPVERLAPTVNPVDLVPYLAKYW
ncbi:glutathione peroxidase domain-containing protein [Phthorimaea operculella]|nr:glutathione peroxidase domain-containing protein [Phthorimaea operculella]